MSRDTSNSNLRLGRRPFLQAGAGLVVAGSAGPAFAATGGTLRIAAPDAPDTLDPQASMGGPGWQASNLVYDNLTGLDANDQPTPQLATGWTPEKGALEWVFELRQGVSFHHGTPFTSADVVASIERAQNPQGGLAARGSFGPLQTVAAEGPFKIRFVMARPFAELPVVLAGEFGRILPADRLDQLKTAPSGTGPFKFQDFQPGSSVSFVRNPAYWLPGQPGLDAVRLVVIRDSSAQQAALRAGAVDIITRLPPEAMLTLRAAPGVKPYSIPSGIYHAVMMQANMAPFDNPKVREAFKYLIDRPALRVSALFGQGALGNDLPVPPGNVYLTSFPQRGQDLAKAKALLDESGVGKLTLDIFTTSERPPAPKMALALAEAAGKIGVTLNIRDVPYTEYLANVARKKPLYTSSFGAAPTLFQMLYRMQHLGQPYNYGQEGDAATDALLDTMIGEADFDKRKALAAQVLQHSYTQGEMIVPYFLPYLCATSAKVAGFVPPRYSVFDVRPITLTS